jgi:glycosyltransferase involved in cell wall biosynthesis
LIKNHLVSIIIPVFNSENSIRETLKSALNQTYENIEVIVINDGSIDTSEDIILAFNDSRIIYRYQRNQGSPIAKNLGLSIANGEYIQFLDADDLLSVDKIENQIKLLDGKSDSICVCRTQIFYNLEDLSNNNNLEEIDTCFINFSDKPIEFLFNLLGVNGRVGMVQPNAYLTPMAIIKKAGYWSTLLNRSPDDDSEFFCRVLLHSNKIIYDQTSINYYRKSINSLSSGKSLLHAYGALKTIELKTKIILDYNNTSIVKNALANSFANLAYNYGSLHPEIIVKVKQKLNDLLGYKSIPIVGGKYFKIISSVFGFENTQKIKYFLNNL